MQLTGSPVYSNSLFTFNFTNPLPEPAYTWTTPDYRGLENRPRAKHDVLKTVDDVIVFILRNEFHFSGVHGAMNRSGSRAK